MSTDTDFMLTHAALFVEDFDVTTGVTLLDDEPGAGPGTETTVADPPPPPVDLEAVRSEAFEAGVRFAARGVETRLAEAAERMTAALVGALCEAGSAARAVAEEAAAAIARTALAAIAAALPAACSKHGGREIAALARAVLPGLTTAPRVTLRVSACGATEMERIVKQLDPDLHGRVEIVPSDSVPAGDVRIVWQDGHAVRDTGAVLRAVDEALAMLGFIDASTAIGAAPARGAPVISKERQNA